MNSSLTRFFFNFVTTTSIQGKNLFKICRHDLAASCTFIAHSEEDET